jgi:hypothetical protein
VNVGGTSNFLHVFPLDNITLGRRKGDRILQHYLWASIPKDFGNVRANRSANCSTNMELRISTPWETIYGTNFKSHLVHDVLQGEGRGPHEGHELRSRGCYERSGQLNARMHAGRLRFKAIR